MRKKRFGEERVGVFLKRCACTAFFFRCRRCNASVEIALKVLLDACQLFIDKSPEMRTFDRSFSATIRSVGRAVAGSVWVILRHGTHLSSRPLFIVETCTFGERASTCRPLPSSVSPLYSQKMNVNAHVVFIAQSTAITISPAEAFFDRRSDDI